MATAIWIGLMFIAASNNVQLTGKGSEHVPTIVTAYCFVFDALLLWALFR